jgi:hypothetical protein
MDDQAAKSLLRKHEDVRAHVYPDSEGNPTIGVGCLLAKLQNGEPVEVPGIRRRITALGVEFDALLRGDVGLSDEQIEALFEEDYQAALARSRGYVANFDEHPDEICSVIVNMNFNLGNRFGKFDDTIAGFVAKDYGKAADGMVDSRWYLQVKTRAVELVSMVRACAQ